jgi:hypothetical protein
VDDVQSHNEIEQWEPKAQMQLLRASFSLSLPRKSRKATVRSECAGREPRPGVWGAINRANHSGVL